MHRRRIIINAIKTQLKTLGVGGVWNQRAPPTRNVWPAITIYAEEEKIEVVPSYEYPIKSRSQNRYLTLAVSIWLRAEQDAEKIEEDMDDWALNVEQTIANDGAMGIEDLMLQNTEFGIAEEDPKISIITLTYSIMYYTEEQKPE